MAATFWVTIKKVASSWSEDRIPSLAAALAYYTIFSITPLLIIGISMLGVFLGPEASRGQVVHYISDVVGQEAGTQIQNMIISASMPKSAKLAQLGSFVMLIIGVTGLFAELQSGLNTIWGVKSQPQQTWVHFLWHQFLSYLMVWVAVSLLFFSLMLDIAITFISTSNVISSLGFLMPTLSWCLSFLIITSLFALMFKVLPQTHIQWREVWIGALITSLLFTLGKFLLGFYLSYNVTLSIYGASSSLVVLLIWVYYVTQIFFIGAEITKAISTEHK